MKIAVCIKQVPDTNEIKLDPITGTLIREGVPSIINHDDKSGIEAALRLAERTGGTVTAICMGPPQAEAALREALAMGCHEAVLVSAREFGGSDTYATATILSAALKKIGYDLVITGRQAIDGDTAQVGPQIAENLNIPQVSYVEKIDLEGDKIIVVRQFEDRYHIIEVKPPCLLTVLQEYARPRYTSIRGISRAYKTDIKLFNFETLKDYFDPSHIGLRGSPTNVFKSFTKQIKGQGTKITNLSSDEAVKVIMNKLEELHII